MRNLYRIRVLADSGFESVGFLKEVRKFGFNTVAKNWNLQDGRKASQLKRRGEQGTLVNRARTRRAIDVTSYAEVVLAPPAADALHPAFSISLCKPRSSESGEQYFALAGPAPGTSNRPGFCTWWPRMGAVRRGLYETDRMQFIGRGNTLVDPQAMSGSADRLDPLSGSEGSVLDPIVAIRYRVTLEPEESVTIDMVSGIGETREAALSLVEKYQDRRLADRVFDLAWTHGQALLRQSNASEADAQLYGRLAGSIIYANATLRADPSVLIKNHRGQSGLWGYSSLLLKNGGLRPVDLLFDPHSILAYHALVIKAQLCSMDVSDTPMFAFFPFGCFFHLSLLWPGVCMIFTHPAPKLCLRTSLL